MALPLSNNAEGGADGVVVTVGNSGGISGDPFTLVTAGVVTFDDDQPLAIANGLLAYDMGAPPNATYVVEWGSSAIGSAPTTFYGRFYTYRAATPTEQQRYIRCFEATTDTEMCRLSWHTDGKLYWFDSTLAVPAASSFTLTAGQLIRIEYRVVCHPTTGVLEAKAYVGHSTTEIGTYTVSNVNTLTNGLGRIAQGCATNATPGQFWLDGLQVNSTGYPGPLANFRKGRQRLAGPVLLPATASSLFTVPAGMRATIHKIYINNKAGNGQADVTMSIGDDASSTRFYDTIQVPDDDSVNYRRLANHTLEANEKLQAKANPGNLLTCVIDGFVTRI